jgi:hypothetical protein
LGLTTPSRKNLLLRGHEGDQDPQRAAAPVKKENKSCKTRVPECYMTRKFIIYTPTHNFRVIKSRRLGEAGHVERMVRKPEGKRPFRTPMSRWSYNTETNLRGISLRILIILFCLSGKFL